MPVHVLGLLSSKGQPLLPQLDVKISCSRGQGIRFSVSVLALFPIIPVSVGPPSEADGSTGRGEIQIPDLLLSVL